MIGFGTYKVGFIPASASAAVAGQDQQGSKEETARECVLSALECGYRFLDCAQFYGNEKEVGLAIKDSGIPREELFLASKVWTDKIFEGADAVRTQIQQTLDDLGTDYLDLYLIHWPVPGKHVEAYQVLEELQAQGKLRSIGVSNYVIEDIEELMQSAKVVPAINQIEVNPFLYRKKTISYCQSKGIVVQAYRALRDGKAFSHPVIVKMSEKYKKSPANILGRWCVQKNVIYIPKSVKKERMLANMDVFDWKLEEQDVQELDLLTTQENLETFKALYLKCVLRDTPLSGTEEGKKLLRFFHGRVEPHYRAVPRLPSSQSTALHCRPLAGRSAAYRRWQFPSTRTGPGGGNSLCNNRRC